MTFARSLMLVLACGATLLAADKEQSGEKKVGPALNFKMKSLAGKDVDLGKYQGQVVLMVNVASECGYTPQYEGLQGLHEKYGEKGLAVLGFPCNDFGAQEPGTSEKIAEFCKANYGVKFDMFSKVAIKGKEPTPLYKFLTSKEANPKFGGPVGWNFEKFLIGRDGTVIGRFAPDVEPTDEALVQAIDKALEQK